MSEERFTSPEQKKAEEKPVEAQKEQEKARAEHKPVEKPVEEKEEKAPEKKEEREKKQEPEKEEVKPVLERVYTFNLREAYKKPYYKRANYAVRLLRKLASKHLKSEDVKLDPELAQFVRASGQPKPRVKVKASKFEDGTVKVRLA